MKAVFGLMLALIAAPSLGQPLPTFEFKGIKAGEVVDPKVVKRCFEKKTGVECWQYHDRVAGVDALTITTFVGGKLSTIGGYVDEAHYSDVLAAFKAKYGEPCSVSTEPWQNALGANFENPISTWCFSSGTLLLKKVGRKISESAFYYVDSNKAPEPEPKVDF